VTLGQLLSPFVLGNRIVEERAFLILSLLNFRDHLTLVAESLKSPFKAESVQKYVCCHDQTVPAD